MIYFLFYLLLLFIPVQLGRHFFFDFTSVSGIYSDYLTPTIYFTDIIVFLLIIMSLRGSASWRRRGNLSIYLSSYSREIPRFARNDKKITVLLLVISYLLFNALIVASNKWAALYKFLKIAEFILLGFVISRLRPKLKTIIAVLSVSVFYSGVLAIWQFLLQKSVGGFFWWLGERTFYASTPGIAAFSYNGNLLLRPYATFPHPNVLGGFLAVILPFLLFFLNKNWQKSSKLLKSLIVISLVVGFIALTLSFSRVAWLVTLFGLILYFLEKKIQISTKISFRKEMILFIFYLFIGVSIIVPLVIPDFSFTKHQYWQERVELIKAAIPMMLTNLPFGVGLNNSIIQVQNYIKSSPGFYIFQPVHNIYLLILTETGIFGFFFFLIFTAVVINNLLKGKRIFLYSVVQLFILGLFDHYLLTLQQGQLLFVIFAALTFIPKMAY